MPTTILRLAIVQMQNKQKTILSHYRKKTLFFAADPFIPTVHILCEIFLEQLCITDREVGNLVVKKLQKIL